MSAPEKLDCRHLDAVRDLASLCFSKTWSRQDFAYFLGHECRLALGRFAGDSARVLDAYFIGLLVQGELDVISVATRPAARRRGLAESLIRFACAQPAVERAFLEVDAENAAAIALYGKLDFTVLSRRRGYYENRRDALVMKWSRPSAER